MSEPGASDEEPGRISRSQALLGVVAANPVRIAIGCLAIAGLVLGAIISWRAASATALLIVSAVILILAALGLDWNTLRGKYGGWTFELLRERLEEHVDRIGEASEAAGEVPEVVQHELNALRAEVRALPPVAGPVKLAPPSWSVNLDQIIRESMATKASHVFDRFSGSVKLTLRTKTSVDNPPFRCTVTTPAGTSYDKTIGTSVRDPFGVSKFTLTYPDEFLDSEPLRPGRYEVEWRQVPTTTPSIQNAIVAGMSPPLARDSFTIPGEES